MKIIKQIFLIILVLKTLVGYSQIENEKNQIYFSDGVEINIINTDCIDKASGIEKQLLVVELINTNMYAINVSFKKEIWYDNNCQTCNTNSDEYTVNQIIVDNSTVIGGCKSENKSLNIFVKMLNLDNVRQLTNYELKDIKIEKVN